MSQCSRPTPLKRFPRCPRSRTCGSVSSFASTSRGVRRTTRHCAERTKTSLELTALWPPGAPLWSAVSRGSGGFRGARQHLQASHNCFFVESLDFLRENICTGMNLSRNLSCSDQPNERGPLRQSMQISSRQLSPRTEWARRKPYATISMTPTFACLKALVNP